jgi:hypothetical protein
VSNGENGHEKGDESVYMWCSRATSSCYDAIDRAATNKI